MRNFLAVALPNFTLFSFIIKKPTAVFFTIAPAVVVSPVVDFKGVAWILFWLFLADLVTGVLGSYFEWKNKADRKDKWFFGKGEGFSSDKFKKMFVKGMVYMGFPLILYKFQKVFFIKNLRYESISDAEITLPTFILLLFCLNEGFSIVHENLPKCGFNLFERIKLMSNKLWSAWRSIKGETVNEN